MYAAIENPPITLEAYRALTREWEVTPVRTRERIVGAVIRVGTELHVGWRERPIGSQRLLVRDILQHTIDVYGFATTKVRAFNTRGLDFCRRLGFAITHESNGIIHLRCRIARHA